MVEISVVAAAIAGDSHAPAGCVLWCALYVTIPAAFWKVSCSDMVAQLDVEATLLAEPFCKANLH